MNVVTPTKQVVIITYNYLNKFKINLLSFLTFRLSYYKLTS